jgi:hypothetical protein
VAIQKLSQMGGVKKEELEAKKEELLATKDDGGSAASSVGSAASSLVAKKEEVEGVETEKKVAKKEELVDPDEALRNVRRKIERVKARLATSERAPSSVGVVDVCEILGDD